MVEWITQLPIWWANVITLVLFVSIGAAVFLIPRESLFTDAPDRSGWRDLRWWALGLVVVQLGIYTLFG